MANKDEHPDFDRINNLLAELGTKLSKYRNLEGTKPAEF
jgi:hypothetical protein